ncbi:hypothetical protein Pelo_14476 [Pelomyxa schiedti]|nr:hypothetical protein Pelo_14476 [Pelomyxa schiedti]
MAHAKSRTPKPLTAVVMKEVPAEGALRLSLLVGDGVGPCVGGSRFDTSNIGPQDYWIYEKAKKEPATGIIPQGAECVVELEVLEQSMEACLAPYPVFLALFKFDNYACKLVPYQKLTPDEFRKALNPTVWPPSAESLGTEKFPSFISTEEPSFLWDNICAALERRDGKPYLYSSKQPMPGMNLVVNVYMKERGYERMTGEVSVVRELPPFPHVDPVVGTSFFTTCTCGKPHPREDIIRSLGTLHGHRVEAVLYLMPDDVGLIPQLSGQWDAVLVADDTKEMIWQLEELHPRPRHLWLSPPHYSW